MCTTSQITPLCFRCACTFDALPSPCRCLRNARSFCAGYAGIRRNKLEFAAVPNDFGRCKLSSSSVYLRSGEERVLRCHVEEGICQIFFCGLRGELGQVSEGQRSVASIISTAFHPSPCFAQSHVPIVCQSFCHQLRRGMAGRFPLFGKTTANC